MLRVVSDITQCECLWNRFIGHDPMSIFDLWVVRDIFHSRYGHTPFFVLDEGSSGTRGFLPLSAIDEQGCYGFFPGETWHGQTWIERNRFYAESPSVLDGMTASLDGYFNLRYIEAEKMPVGYEDFALDETGFLFCPPDYGYSYDTYLEVFPRKSLKKLMREVQEVGSPGVSFRFDELKDFDILVEMNVSLHGEDSYFSDPRFVSSFEGLLSWLAREGFLRITTVLIGGKVAAIDIGSLWKGQYTIFGGGVSHEFPGVAKLINFHHLETACRERHEFVDFLCGNFNWKERFRLKPRHTYKIAGNVPAAEALPELVAAYG